MSLSHTGHKLIAIVSFNKVYDQRDIHEVVRSVWEIGLSQ